MAVPVVSKKDNFLQYANRVTGLPIERIERALRTHFGAYSYRNEARYMVYLRAIQAGEMKKEEAEAKIQEHLQRTQAVVTCPLCGAATRGEARLFGRHTRKPGWICTRGGVRHFWWDKANQIMARAGQGAKDLAWWEAQDARLKEAVAET